MHLIYYHPVPPIFLDEKVKTILFEQKATSDTEMQIQCQVIGLPAPSVTLHRNGVPLSVQSISVSNAGPYGIYQCFANNSAGASYRIIRVLWKGRINASFLHPVCMLLHLPASLPITDTVNPPSNILCNRNMTSQAIHISWMAPKYFGSDTWTNYNYRIYYCPGPDSDSMTTDTHYQLQLDTVTNRTIYVRAVVYGSTMQSAPAFCQFPQTNQCKYHTIYVRN